MTFRRWDIVRLTFPYVEGYDAKKRPALIVSTDALSAVHRVYWALMITTAKGGTLPQDIPVTDALAVGLVEECVIRPSRLFTISKDLTDRKLGSLKPRDRNAVIAFLKKYMPH